MNLLCAAVGTVMIYALSISSYVHISMNTVYFSIVNCVDSMHDYLLYYFCNGLEFNLCDYNKGGYIIILSER